MKIKKDFETLLVISSGLALLYFWLDIVYLWYISISILVLGVISPWLGRHIVRVWKGLSMILGAINTHILLAIVFYLILTPVALLRRILSKRPELDQTRSSFFLTRQHTYEPHDFEHPW
ncbi:hypothetical protein SAMN04488029_1118 [Reichenbachiella faecimaris]|uniref:SxtJ n=1 Tax=Reichenbachiella faecimaris TaxID=692418 RepID=A0A1W2G7W8_REIFA|nr:SxtJ family membrane protein [Reichenbachiella faecimaris]SMD32767.1 hypothetical protein SAMN04488029_1118 [Reichenbachiella faecimaris]